METIQSRGVTDEEEARIFELLALDPFKPLPMVQSKKSSLEVDGLTMSKIIGTQWYLVQLVRHSPADHERALDSSSRRTDLG